MRGLLDGQWYDLERWPEAEKWLPAPVYTIKDDPERGSFSADEFEEIDTGIGARRETEDDAR